MSNEFTRRSALLQIGRAVVLAGAGVGVLPRALAQQLHEHLLEVKSLAPTGTYKPAYLSTHEYETLKILAESIVPGALDGGAPEFIDFLCSRNDELASIFTGGLAWTDDEMRRRYSAPFIDARPEQRTALLDVIAYRKNETPETAPGIHFFNWTRNMVVDAYYTSPAGIKEIGFMGNGAVSQFSVPQEAIDYAIKRSPFAG